MLPTLDETKDWMRVQHTLDDPIIQSCLDSAVEMVKNFLDRELPWTTNCYSSSSDNVEPIPANVITAILMLTEHLYDNRSAGLSTVLEPWSTEWMLLAPHRRLGI